ncbi:MAG: EAL domain-containing protein, partial [Cyanobacteria bacterium J06638_22]
MITSLDHWMLQKACEQLAFWHQQFPQWKHLRMCVNFSGKELQESSLVETIKNVLAQTGVPANCLTLEITENVLIQNISQTIEMLHKLKSHGIQISIDDFGTGYSSLSYLHHLPANSLKIDKSFISRMRKNGRDYKISQAIIALSNQLQMNAIAEGIETFQQLQWLREMGCEQG